MTVVMLLFLIFLSVTIIIKWSGNINQSESTTTGPSGLDTIVYSNFLLPQQLTGERRVPLGYSVKYDNQKLLSIVVKLVEVQVSANDVFVTALVSSKPGLADQKITVSLVDQQGRYARLIKQRSADLYPQSTDYTSQKLDQTTAAGLKQFQGQFAVLMFDLDSAVNEENPDYEYLGCNQDLARSLTLDGDLIKSDCVLLSRQLYVQESAD